MGFWDSRHVKKTRKQHRCELCGIKIPIGSSCYQENGKFEGEFNYYHLCERCHHCVSEYRDEFLDDGYLVCFQESVYSLGLMYCPECGGGGDVDEDESYQHLKVMCERCGHNYTVDLSIDGIDAFLDDEGVEQ